MAKGNNSGLSRHIPAEVKREVRRRCKFGCVVCRSGFYQYEHIDDYVTVADHDPDRICCLCGACHDRVTRKQLSKAAIESAYQRVWHATPEQTPAPTGPLDFHSGTAHLVIGGLRYDPLVKAVLRYHDEDLFRVEPGDDGRPGSISAVFFDELGHRLFEIKENEWIGNPSSWDIEIVGQKLSVRNTEKRIVLALRLDPPGSVVIERLDMRCGDAHVLVSEQSYALGRYFGDEQIVWVYADISITRSVPDAVALEFAAPDELQRRSQCLDGVGQSLIASNGNWIMGSPMGLAYIPAGISIAYGCSYRMYGAAMAVKPLSLVRKLVQGDPAGLAAAFRQSAGTLSK